MKMAMRFSWAFWGVGCLLCLLVVVLGYLTHFLTPKDTVSLQRAAAFEQQIKRLSSGTEIFVETQDAQTGKRVAAHRVTEWPQTQGRTFFQSPMLNLQVVHKKLPPVEERLPENPLVIVPPEQNGPYGGTWTRFGNGPQDVGILEARLAYDGLVRWDAMCSKVLPNLAVSWTIADSGKVFTFFLRKGVKWSDGQPCTADDILFWYHHVLLNKELTPVIPRDFKRDGEVVLVEKLDAHTVQFRFKQPHGIFLYALASGRGYEVIRDPAHYMRQFHPDFVPQDSLMAKARAAGLDLWSRLYEDKRDWRNPEMPRLWPWVMKEPPPAMPIVLERNPYYWKVDPEGNQLPYIDRMTFEIYDAETINFKAINGEMGMQERHLQFTNYPLFMENSKRGGYRVLHWVAGQGGTQVLLPNLNHKDPAMNGLMNDRRFRFALSLALNRDEINQVGFFGVGKPRQMAPPATSAFYSAEYEKAYIEYDPKRANQLLDEIGLKKDAQGRRLLANGKPIKLTLEVASESGSPMMALVADYWTQVGLVTEVKDLARPLWYQRIRAMMHDVTAWSSADEQNPLLDPRWFFPNDGDAFYAPAFGRWHDTDGKAGVEPPEEIKACMRIFRQIEKTTDPDEQLRLFQKIIELDRQNLWTIGLVGDVPSILVVKNTFRNVPDVAVTGWSFRTPGNTAPECYAIDEMGKQ